MYLTASTFEQISGSLRSDASAARDQRHQPRVGLRARAKIVPMVLDDKGAAPIDVWVRDLSAGGIGLTCTKGLPRGSLFTLRLMHPDGTFAEVKYKVTYTNVTSGGAHVIGAARQLA